MGRGENKPNRISLDAIFNDAAAARRRVDFALTKTESSSGLSKVIRSEWRDIVTGEISHTERPAICTETQEGIVMEERWLVDGSRYREDGLPTYILRTPEGTLKQASYLIGDEKPEALSAIKSIDFYSTPSAGITEINMIVNKEIDRQSVVVFRPDGKLASILRQGLSNEYVARDESSMSLHHDTEPAQIIYQNGKVRELRWYQFGEQKRAGIGPSYVRYYANGQVEMLGWQEKVKARLDFNQDGSFKSAEGLDVVSYTNNIPTHVSVPSHTFLATLAAMTDIGEWMIPAETFELNRMFRSGVHGQLQEASRRAVRLVQEDNPRGSWR